MRFLSIVAYSLIAFSIAQQAVADIVDLAVDPNVSNLNLSINNSAFQNTAILGDGVIDVASCVAPFGTAQITSLDLTLNDGLSFSLLGGFVTASTTAGDVTISMVTPGAPGTVTGGFFDQLGNTMAFGGNIIISDPLNLFGGNQTIDLSTQPPTLVDFTGLEITRVGDIKTVAGSFAISDNIDVGGTLVPFVANGFFSASGNVPAIPEPGSLITMILLSSSICLARRRQTN